MFFEAELALAPRAATAPRRVAPEHIGGKLLHFLTAGWVGETWQEEAIEPVDLLRRIRWSLRTTGIDDIVAATRDGEVAYLDRSGRSGDLDAVIERLLQYEEGSPGFGRAELLVEHRRPPVKYLVCVSLDRIHPPDRLPIRCRVYALLDEYSMAHDGASAADIWQRLSHGMRTPDGFKQLMAAAKPEVVKFVAELVAALRRDLDAHRTKPWLRRCVVISKQRRNDAAALTPREELDASPVFRGFPGFPAATLYTHWWAELCHQNNVAFDHTLFVDEAGRPVCHVRDTTIDAGQCPALVPGAPFAGGMPTIGVKYFGGHDYEDELRRARLLGAAPEGTEAIREALRRHEIGDAKLRTSTRSSSVTGFGPLLTVESGGSSDWGGYI